MDDRSDIRKKWGIEQEIDWLIFHIGLNEKSLAYQRKKLAEYQAEQDAWWKRFINYCQTGK